MGLTEHWNLTLSLGKKKCFNIFLRILVLEQFAKLPLAGQRNCLKNIDVSVTCIEMYFVADNNEYLLISCE